MHVRQITDADWDAYRDYLKGLSEIRQYSGFFEGKDLDDPQTFQDFSDQIICDGETVMFGLWKDEHTLIGQGSVQFFDKGKTALIAGGEITDAYRGQHLIDHLYKARLDYLHEIGFEGDITVGIKPDNLRSIRAAERNGFVNTREIDKHGCYVFRLAGVLASPAPPVPEPPKPAGMA